MASDNTSIDDKTEDFCENPTRDALTEGLMSLLKPTVDQLDERIRATRYIIVTIPRNIYENVLVLHKSLYTRFASNCCSNQSSDVAVVTFK